MLSSDATPRHPSRGVLLALLLLLLAASPGLRAQAADTPAAAASSAERALRYEGQNFERRANVGGQEVQLNGVGTRGWFKAFFAALYVTQPSRAGNELVAQKGAKRLQIRINFDLPAEAFAKALRKGLLRNLPEPSQAALMEARMQAFEASVQALGTVHKGDVIDLDFDPASGLLFKVNGTLHGAALPGADFYAALLRAFIGEQPYDDQLKAGLLGRRP